MAGDLRGRGRSGGQGRQQSMDMGGGRAPSSTRDDTDDSANPARFGPPLSSRPEWARDPEGALVTEEQAAEFRGFKLETLGEAFRLAAACVEGKLVPKGMTEGGVVAIWQRGYEAGLQPMEALESLYVINGKVGMYVDKLITRARERGAFAPGGRPTLRWWIGDEMMPEGWDPQEVYSSTLSEWPSDLRAVVSAIPASEPDMVLRRSFSVGDARLSGKWDKDPDSAWSKYPARMLRKSAAAFLIRDEFNEFTGGLTSVEELRNAPEEKDITPPAGPPPDLGRDPALDAVRKPDRIEKPDGTEA